MEIDVTQLQMGDEFLYSVQGSIARAKVIRPVEQRKVQPSYGHPAGQPYYKSVKCKVSIVEKTYSWSNGRTWTKKEYTATEDYNVEKYINLNHRNLWLIKKAK
jgi:hypothetical protein